MLYASHWHFRIFCTENNPSILRFVNNRFSDYFFWELVRIERFSLQKAFEEKWQSSVMCIPKDIWDRHGSHSTWFGSALDMLWHQTTFRHTAYPILVTLYTSFSSAMLFANPPTIFHTESLVPFLHLSLKLKILPENKFMRNKWNGFFLPFWVCETESICKLWQYWPDRISSICDWPMRWLSRY